MRIDHVVYAAGPEGLRATARRLADRLGVTAHAGGVHPRFGTRNMILPLAGERYVEVVEALDHPACDKEPFGQAVKAASERGGGWMAWVVSVDDLAPLEERLGRASAPGNRHTPEGFEITWRQIGVDALVTDPQLPYFLHWDSIEHHPSRLAEADVRLAALHIAGDVDRVRAWLDLDATDGPWETDVDFEFLGDRDPGLESVTFTTLQGAVTV